ncbi:unnamed protein product [Closterium sp. NIES-65]|nr:unnamed protein product [Closterium sp. NIES-65]
MFPDAIAAVQSALHPSVCSAILDAEIVPVSHETTPQGFHKLLPFQVLSRRERGSKERAESREEPGKASKGQRKMIAGTAIGATKAGGSKQDEREERGGGDSSISARTGQGERVDAMEEDGREATGRGIEEGGMGATEGWVEEVDGVRGVQGAGGEAEASTKEAVVAAVGSGCSSRSMAGPQVCVCVFDMLYLNGQSLVKKSLRERREALVAALPGAASSEVPGGLMVVAQTEGLMVKLLDGPPSFYFPNKRSDSWLKVKRDYVAGLGDSLDLVPIGAWHGNGRKAGW